MTAERWRPHSGGLYGRFCDAGVFPGVTAVAVGAGLLVLPGAYVFWAAERILALALLAVVLLLICSRYLPGLNRRILIYPVATLLSLLFLGYSYGHWSMTAALSARVPLCADAEVGEFEMTIVGTPQEEGFVLTSGETRTVARFRAIVQPIERQDCLDADTYQVRMSWYDPPLLIQGASWRVEARIRPPWGNSNPGGFDYERWLLGQAFNGTGYVRRGRLLSEPLTQDYRANLRARLWDWLAHSGIDHQGIVLALMTGDDSALNRNDWQSLRDSGTVHLLVVSGLHVGMVTGFLFFLARFLLRPCLPLFQRFGTRRLAGILALTGSGFYVWISGAGVPAVRAWVMGALLLAALGSGREVSTLRIVGVVMALTVLLNPLVVHQQGFWLSFVAVLALVAFFQPVLIWERVTGTGRPHDLRQRMLRQRMLRPLGGFIKVQILLLLVLSPMLASSQGAIPLQAPLVNGLVVPVVAFAVLPLILVTGVLIPLIPALAGWTVQKADWLLGFVMSTIESAAAVPAVAMSVGGLTEWLLIGFGLFVLGCRSMWQPGLALVGLWWAVLLPDQMAPHHGEFRITALDVGQGSSILIDTRHHRLIYDTGAAHPSGFDLGSAVVVPSFRRALNQSLSALVLSHDDLDHTGGVAAVVAGLQPQVIWSSFPVSVDPHGTPRLESCRTGRQWGWDGVSFRFLHPPAGWWGNDNDSSCVLMISTGQHSALIGGDISKRVERRLPLEPVDLLFAPHHGSRTSSSAALVRRLMPGIVFISTERRSRYGHPHPEVIERYAAADVHVSGRHGALVWDSGSPGRVVRWREVHGAYWHRWPQSEGRALSSL